MATTYRLATDKQLGRRRQGQRPALPKTVASFGEAALLIGITRSGVSRLVMRGRLTGWMRTSKRCAGVMRTSIAKYLYGAKLDNITNTNIYNRVKHD
jgi:hypothetical protein